MSQDLIAVVERLCASWSTDWEGFLDSYREFLAPDGVYVAHPDFPPTTGADAAIELLGPFNQMGVESIDVDIVRIAQDGDTVWSERIDHMKNASGERFLGIPIAGVMTFDDNAKITRWVDYWDIAKLKEATGA